MEELRPIKSVEQLCITVQMYRKRRGITLEALSDLSRIDAAFLYELERGEEKLELEKVMKLLSVLGLEIILREQTPNSKTLLSSSAVEARMMLAAKQAVLTSTSWLTIESLQKIQRPTLGVTLESPEEWIQQGRIFSIDNCGKYFFPFYALDSDHNFHPYKDLAEILSVFKGHRSSWGVAFWFSSINGFLGGLRPQDLLISQPQFVLAAAHNEIQGITHG